MLLGSEVKSLRAGKANLRDGYARIKNEEVFLLHVHISPYSHATYDAPDPVRERKLLLKKREILKLGEGQGCSRPGQRQEALRQAGIAEKERYGPRD